MTQLKWWRLYCIYKVRLQCWNSCLVLLVGAGTTKQRRHNTTLKAVGIDPPRSSPDWMLTLLKCVAQLFCGGLQRPLCALYDFLMSSICPLWYIYLFSWWIFSKLFAYVVFIIWWDSRTGCSSFSFFSGGIHYKVDGVQWPTACEKIGNKKIWE